MAEFIPTAYEAVAGGYRYRAWKNEGGWYVMRGRTEDLWSPSVTQVLQAAGWVLTTQRKAGKDVTFQTIDDLTQYLGVLLLD
jgi:hypothetical protein